MSEGRKEDPLNSPTLATGERWREMLSLMTPLPVTHLKFSPDGTMFASAYNVGRREGGREGGKREGGRKGREREGGREVRGRERERERERERFSILQNDRLVKIWYRRVGKGESLNQHVN